MRYDHELTSSLGDLFLYGAHLLPDTGIAVGTLMMIGAATEGEGGDGNGAATEGDGEAATEGVGAVWMIRGPNGLGSDSRDLRIIRKMAAAREKSGSNTSNTIMISNKTIFVFHLNLH